jgi:hypothetical protein
MSELARKVHDSLGLDLAYRRLPLAVVRAVDRANHRALVAAARVEGAAYVTHVALGAVARLTNEEGHLITMCPLAELRLRVIGDTFAGVAAAEVAGMAY